MADVLTIFKELRSGLNVGTQTQVLGDFPGDGHVISGHHLDLNAMLFRVGNGLGGIFPGGIKKRQNSQKLPGTCIGGTSYPQGPIALGGQGIHRFLGLRGSLRFQVAQSHNDLGSALGHLEEMISGILNRAFRPFAHRIKGHKFRLAVCRQHVLVF